MACIGGTLLYVAQGMVKKVEISAVRATGPFEVFIMIGTAILVPLFGFMIGVMTAIVAYVILSRFIKNRGASRQNDDVNGPRNNISVHDHESKLH